MYVSFVIAILAPVVTSIQFLPQLVKTLKTKRVGDLSVYSLLLLLGGNVLWLLHGYFQKDVSLIVAGITGTLISLVLLIVYLDFL